MCCNVMMTSSMSPTEVRPLRFTLIAATPYLGMPVSKSIVATILSSLMDRMPDGACEIAGANS